ncbi:hypothetical protein CBS101457_002275 [Exobasidium rhododendri]|nr:hypothetical protein CBS101457_002275 [Exobasidium rhododendri]
MSQKEVIHLTFGSLSQHISTHFFNQQSSHFQYDGHASDDSSKSKKDDDVPLDPTVDFQEGIGSRRNEQTFFPRQIIAGFRDDMGTGWDAYSVVLEEDEEGMEEDDDTILRPSNAVNEGFHAWARPAELLHTEGVKKIRSARQQMQWDDDDGAELSASDVDDDDDDADDSEGRSRLPTSEPSVRKSEIVKPSKQNMTRSKLIQHKTPAMYAHTPLHPRSVYPLPRLYGSGVVMPMNSGEDVEGSNPFSSFEMGILLAKEMEREKSMTEDSIRWLAEDSDSLQLFNLTTCTSDGFSGFSHEVMQSLADEYPKTPIIAWGAQWGSTQEEVEGKEKKLGRLRQMNNILSLWSLSSASLYVPLQIPEQLTHHRDAKKKIHHYFSSRADWTDEYQAGALFSAHIDTSMMRLRLRNADQRTSAASLVASLNWRKDTPIACLGGCMPIPLLAPFGKRAAAIDPIEALLASRGYGSSRRGRDERNFETPQERAVKAANQIQQYFMHFSRAPSTHSSANFAESIVARDDDTMAEIPTREGLEAWSHLQEPVAQSTVVKLPYRVQQASFPQIFSKLSSTGRPMPEDWKGRPKVQTIPVLSSLFTSPRSAMALREARNYLDKKVIKGHESLTSFGLGGSRGSSAGQAASDESEGPLGGRDGMIEVRERLEEILGAYEGDGDGGEEEGEGEQLGTDEEYEDQVEEWDISD